MGLKGFFEAFVFAAILIALVPASTAAEYNVEISPGYQNIKMSSVAEYELTIKNNLETEETFEIYSPEVTWDIRTDPVSDSSVRIGPGENKTVRLMVKPLYVNPGFYGVSIHIRVPSKGMLIREYIMIGAEDPNPPPGEYLPSIRATVNMDRLIDPRDNVTFNLTLENRNRRDIKNIDIRIRSNVINTDLNTNLGPLEEKKLTVTMPVDPLTKPQTDLIKILMFTTALDKTYQHEASPFEFSVLQYGGLEDNITEEKSFLKTVRTIKLVNKGNGDFIDVYKVERGFFTRIFSSSEPEMIKVREGDEIYRGWKVSLDPYESAVIVEVVSYRIPFWALCAVIVMILIYYATRSPVIVHKSAAVLSTKEGGISEIKVLIVVKNRVGRPVKGIEVIDKAPNISNVSTDFEMGTLHPSKVLKHAKKGTLVKWDIKELDRFEERVLSYKIKSGLSVLGEFKLPVAVAKFRKRTGGERTTHSNRVSLISN